jgi:hypothetical protein
MSVEIRFTVMSPEAGVQRVTGGPPPGMGGPPPGAGGPRPGIGGPRPGMGGPPPGMGGPAPSPSSFSFARRPKTLENKTVYLVDTGFGGSYKFMQQLQKWFGEHMPSVTTVRKRKPGNVFMDDTTDLWDEIKEKGQAVVLGVAG